MISDAQREEFTARAVTIRIASNVARREIDLAEAVEILLREYQTQAERCAKFESEQQRAIDLAHRRIEKLREGFLEAIQNDDIPYWIHDGMQDLLRADDALAKEQK